MTIVFNRPDKENQGLKIFQFWCPKLDKICTPSCCRQLLYSSFSFARNQKRVVYAQHARSLRCLIHKVLLGNIKKNFLNLSKMSFPSVISYRVFCQYQVFERPLKSMGLLYYSHSHHKWYCSAFGGGGNVPEVMESKTGQKTDTLLYMWDGITRTMENALL